MDGWLCRSSLAAVEAKFARFQAPEIIKMQTPNPYSFLSDAYAYGIVLYELLSHELPYNDINSRDQILFMVGSGLLKPKLHKLRVDTPKQFRSLLEACLRYNAEERCEFKQVSRVSARVRAC